MELTPGQIEDLLGAWALDALDPAERRAIDAALDADPDLARRALQLADVVADLGEGVQPDADVRAALLGAAAGSARPQPAATEPIEAFSNQVERLRQLLAELTDAQWKRPVEPYVWTVHGLVAHLSVIETYMAGQLDLVPRRRGGPTHHLEMGADEIESELTGRGADTADRWHRRAEATIRALRAGRAGADRAVEFHGWPFTTDTLLIARAFEVWTHADDIRRATARPVTSPIPADLRTMSRFSVESLPLVWPLVAPVVPFVGARVVLTGDGGGTFDLGDTAQRQTLVVADVVDYCRLAARRIDRADLEVTIEGDPAVADQLLAASQVFAV